MNDHPNIVLITTDQQRFDSVGINGSSFMDTPRIDRLGHEGAVFRRAYCPNTVCTPSRASMMTGLHLSRHGAYNIGTSAVDHGLFLSHILRGHGYQNHHIGKAHWFPWGTENAETAKVDQKGTPFNDFAGFETAELSIGHATWGMTGHYRKWLERKGASPKDFNDHLVLTNDPNATADWDLPVELHSGTWVAERAIDFLKNRDRTRPFFLNLGFQDPHHPHVVPSDFHNRVDPEIVPLQGKSGQCEEFSPEHIRHFHDGTWEDSQFRGPFPIAGNESVAWYPYFQDEQKARTTKAYYYSMVQLIDEQLGTILDALDELELADDTLVIYTTDHGEMLGDHGIGQKGPLIYEGVTHIPLFMRYPKGFGSCDVEETVSLVDLVPTILDFAGVDDGVRRDGISLKARIQEGRPIERNGVRIEYKEEADRIRYKGWVTPEWKLAVYMGEEFGELYDLKGDPGENHNLFHDPDYLDIKMRLLIEMLHDMERSEPLSERLSRV
ncbi:MAG TPA: sulfatase-like hydrolase/transferase [Bacillales bacterium]|nr:sulfatase-like hydrolase/transferase [Bacillales bacterium]